MATIEWLLVNQGQARSLRRQLEVDEEHRCIVVPQRRLDTATRLHEDTFGIGEADIGVDAGPIADDER